MENSIFKFFLRIFFSFCALSSAVAMASEDGSKFTDLQRHISEGKTPESLGTMSALPATEVFNRTQKVLTHFQVPIEPDSQSFLADLQNKQTFAGVQAVLPFLELNPTFGGYSMITATALHVFQDASSKKVDDFLVNLIAHPAMERPDFERHIIAASTQNSRTLPLAGLKIALDPGHMGGSIWDQRTGKFVRDRKTGHRISEGVLNLQTALLLEKQLRSLGAEVMITRRSLAPVTSLDYATMGLTPFALEEFRAESVEPWFISLLSTAADGPFLFNAFSHSKGFQNIFGGSNIARDKYFILDADLDARIEKIRNYSPDITMIIHYDTMDPENNPSGINYDGYDGTKTYVLGGYMNDEFASRDDRKWFARHLLDAPGWDASLRLSLSVVANLMAQTGVPYDKTDAGNSRQVKPGVFARNLHIPRKLSDTAVTYVECLYYNDPREFAALSKATYSMTIDGVKFHYSDRLLKVVSGLREGVVSFVQSYPH